MSNKQHISYYTDDEVAAAWKRISAHENLNRFLDRIGFGRLDKLDDVTTVEEYRLLAMRYIEHINKTTTSGVSAGGLEHLTSHEHGVVYMTNHSNILWDSCVMNSILHEHNMYTTCMATGDNLVTDPLAKDILLSDRCFLVRRGGSGAERATIALELSDFIHSRLAQRESVWIAQSKGRCKDGNEKTDPAIIRMLYGRAEHALTIIPVSITYERDPTDTMKAHEVYSTRRDGTYTKASDEDAQSMIRGMLGPKGHVHVQFTPPINLLRGESGKELAQGLAPIIDEQIIRGYHLWPSHHTAYAALNQNYTPPIVDHDFLEHVKAQPAHLQPIILENYANYAKNKFAYENK